MNGLKCIREKSNISKAELADRIGVTRQTITLWESGKRIPSNEHLNGLSSFYGVDKVFFGELDEEKLEALNIKPFYRHCDKSGEYYTFIKGEDDFTWDFESMERMVSEKFQEAEKHCKKVLSQVDNLFHLDKKSDYFLYDRIITAERGCSDVERYLDLLSVVDKVGKERGTFLKVPLRYEIRGVIDAMMLAYGLYSEKEICEKYQNDFGSELRCYVDKKHIIKIADLMRRHWEEKVKANIENRNSCRKKKYNGS